MKNIKTLAIITSLSLSLFGSSDFASSDFLKKNRVKREIICKNTTLCCMPIIGAAAVCATPTILSIAATTFPCSQCPAIGTCVGAKLGVHGTTACLFATGCGFTTSSACCIPYCTKIDNNDNLNTLRKKSSQANKQLAKAACCGAFCTTGSFLCATAACRELLTILVNS